MLVSLATNALPVSNYTALITIILILLLFSTIISGAETAFFSLSTKDIDYLKTHNEGNKRTVIELLQQPKALLATLLIARAFINIAIIVITDYLLILTIEDSLHPAISFLVQILAISFLLVLFSAVLPKVYAKQNTMRMALFAAPVVNFMVSIFSPIGNMLINSTTYIDEKIEHYGNDFDKTGDDFERKLELSMGQTATHEEVDIFKGIMRFQNITARQIMHTRLDVSGIPYGYDFQQLQRFIITTGYSRMPVYQDSLDTIVGMIHSKDLLPHLDDPTFDWHTIVRPAYYVPENKLVDDLLKEFQQKRVHFAVLVDEFGGTSGIVTLEDIMEEIIGDIKDEFDEDDPNFKKINDDNYIFEGKTLIIDVCRFIDVSSDTFDKVRGESDSLAGLILEIAGKFPAINEIITYENFEFTILETDRMRIKRVKVQINRDKEKA